MTESDGDREAGPIAAEIERSTRQLELADPDAHLGRLDRLINRCVEVIGVTALTGIVGVIFVNATSRYLLNNSFAWAEEVVQMTIPWLAMAGVFLSIRRGTAIRIDFFFEKLPPRVQGALARAGFAFNCAVLALLAWVSFDFVRLFGGDVALYVGLPMGVSTSALVFGAAGAAMAYAAAILGAWRPGGSGTDGEER